LQKSNFNLASLAVIVVLLGLLVAVLFPAVSASTIMTDNATAVGTRGKDIYVAITAANTEREPLGLPSVWPKSNPPTNNVVDISQMNFTNSTDYFYALYDGEYVGTEYHNPYVRGFDYSKLAGGGVKPHAGSGRLKPANNMWTIANNVRDTMEEIVPILVTRNLAAESLVTDLEVVSNRHLLFDQEWKTPFGQKYIVIVRKGGGIFTIRGKYASLNILYGNQTFRTTLQGSQAPGLSYLTPSREVIPSEAGYQACVAASGHSKKGAFYDWWEDVKELFETLKYPLFLMLISALMSGAFLFVIVYFDKKWRPALSVMSWGYWLLLWGSVTGYLFCLLIMILDVGQSFPLAVAQLPFLFQVFGFVYLIACDQRTDHPESFKLAMKLLLSAPLLALLCCLLIFSFWVFGTLLFFSVSRLIG
jgi:hypothetical protein